jgi:hypothetical protein
MIARGEVLAFVGAAVCAVGIGLVQPALARTVKTVRLKDETSALPPPRDLRALTFGYQAATADVLWATLLVEYGLHSEEKRPFKSLRRYLDGILALEPDHPTLFQFVDALLVFKPGEVATDDDARAARAYLELGTKARPFDPERWLHYGQFIAFLAPSFLKDEAEIDQWRKDGALAMARAIELGSDPDRSLTVATLLGRAGEQKAAIRQLQHAYALTDADNWQTRQQLLLRLAKLQGSVDVEATVGYVEREWKTRYPFLSRDAALLIGPYRSTAACAGPDARGSKECPDDWSAATRDR